MIEIVTRCMVGVLAIMLTLVFLSALVKEVSMDGVVEDNLSLTAQHELLRQFNSYPLEDLQDDF